MSDSAEKYRLLTRSDFDGLVCAILLKNMDILAEIKFVHPKDVQDGKIEVTDRDILTNLPYVEGCHRCFDHHSSEAIRGAGKGRENQILDPNADSAARVVYESYGGRERFPSVNAEMLEAVDKADSARFTREEVLSPTGWALMAFIMDARTGLGRFRNFRVSNYQLMMDLIDYCNNHTIDEILDLPDIRERIDLYMSHQEDFKEQIQRCSAVHDNLSRDRPASGGDDLLRQSIHGVRALPAVRHLDSCPLGSQEAEHRADDRQVDFRPHLQDQHWRARASVRRRWARSSGHLPGRPRGRRPRSRGDHRQDQCRRGLRGPSVGSTHEQGAPSRRQMMAGLRRLFNRPTVTTRDDLERT